MITVTPPTIPLNYQFSAGVKGEYLPYIVNPDGTEEYPLGKDFMPNVITNIGLDRWMSFVGGVGTNGTDSISKPFANSAWGDLVLTSTINWCRVGSGTNAASVTDTALQTQLTDPAPTSTNFTGSGGCLSVLTSTTTLGTAIHKITKQFPAVVSGPVTINEIGLGWTQTTASTLFSRFVTPAPIVLQTGQQLRVVYQITISVPQFLSSTSVSGITNNGFDITGTSPTKGLRLSGTSINVFGELNSTGGFPAGGNGNGAIWSMISISGFQTNAQTNNPIPQLYYGNLPVLLSTATFNSVGAAPSNTIINGSGSNIYNRTYTGTGAGNNTKYVDRVWEWAINAPVDTVSNIVGMGWHNIEMLFDSNQTKTNEHILRIGLRSSWTRL
jgi:hypothetical protein